MQLSLNNLKISVKLSLTIIFSVAVTVLALTVANVMQSRTMVEASAHEKLEAMSLMQLDRLQLFLETIERDIQLQSTAPVTSQALIALTDGFESLGEDAYDVLHRVYIDENAFPLGEKDQLVSADTGSAYGFIHAIYHPTMDALQDEMSYYDVFLFDTKGNLVYSVFKEEDFATNVITGPWKDTGLAQVFNHAITLDAEAESAFVDFAPYAPSTGAPAAFIARPVHDQTGKLLGVLAFQMPIDTLNDTVSQLHGLGHTSDGYLIGSDFVFRTDSLQTEEVETLAKQLENDAMRNAFAGKHGGFENIGHNGNQVVGYYNPLDFLGVRWAVVVQQETSEIFEGMQSLLLQALLLSLLIFLLVLTVAILFSRSLSQPMRRLTDTVTSVAKGELSATVPETSRGDEIGELARATEIFRQNALKIETLNAEQMQANAKMADLNAEREEAAKREADLFKEKEAADAAAALEREEMMRTLGDSIGVVVNDAISGNFSRRIEVEFEDETLITLSNNINSLMHSVDSGLSETCKLLERVAGGDLSERMEGQFMGAFSDLQQNVNGMIDSLTALILEISETGETMAISSSEMQETAQVLSQRAEANAASVEETSSALEQLSSTVRQVKDNISEASEDAKEARNTAASSEEIAAEAVSSMDRIASGSQEIARVVAVINEIAFQINLLALNAGVEAARAGDAGRGFSVVASEVRALAQRASEAAKEIEEVISASDIAVTDGVSKVASARNLLEQIAGRVIAISERVDLVTTAVAEQSKGIDEISTAAVAIESNTQKQAASLEEVTASSLELASQSKDLKRATTSFQINGKSEGAALREAG